METSLGTFLRQLRLVRRLSQTQAAKLAGIGRVTLNRWETGVQQPRLLDLESLLSALDMTQQERRTALSLLGTPFVSNQNPFSSGQPTLVEPKLGQPKQNIIERVAPLKDIGPMPHRGELLRALRMRQGFSQEETARKIGVTTRTVRRWESSEVWPTPDYISSLCYCLEARTEEMLALTTGNLLFFPDLENASLLELRAYGNTLFFYSDDTHTQALKELGFVMLEIQLWRFATRYEIGRRILSEVYSYHAEYLCRQERFTESGFYADRALDLWPKDASPSTKIVMAGITAAHSATFRGTRPAPHRGMEILGHWSEMAQWPEYKAWILSNMADYMGQMGDTKSSLEFVQKARSIAAHCDNPHELHNRELDEARILIDVGQTRQALILIQKDRTQPYLDHPAKFRLLEVAAYLNLGERSVAHDRFQDALQLIETNNLVHLLNRAKKLALQF
jgi:transcriptional regulator with XRE-family HTH domain